MKDLEKKTKAYALKNAIAHEGVAMQSAVISSLFNEGLKKQDVKKYIQNITKYILEINSLSAEEQKKQFEKLKKKVSERPARQGLPELPDVKKSGIIMRFAPSPSGALHVGHAMTASISYLYTQKYTGKFYLRIEDTNPENIYEPAYELIKQDSEWLFNKKAKIVIQSDRMKLYYKYAEKLINKKVAYVCTCASEQFKEFSQQKKDCPCRRLNVKQNIERWKKMLDKNGFNPGEAVLRFKSSMKDPNPAMRDFPLARINLMQHPRQINKYRVWPLMNLAVTVDDIEMKMTHIIRAKEHRDNAKRQKIIYKALNKEYPWEAYLGRYKFTDLELSASKITQGIKDKEYSGWDDTELPTLAALRKKGYKPSAFWRFAEHVGLSETDKVIDKKEFFKLLDSFNRE